MTFRELLEKLNGLTPEQLEMDCLIHNRENDQMYVLPRLEIANEEHDNLTNSQPFLSFDEMDGDWEDAEENEEGEEDEE